MFTAEEVRKFLGLNDDYSNSSSSSSSDCENDTSSDISFHTNGYQDKSSDEEIIPPSPKRLKNIKNEKGNNTGNNESGQWDNISTSTSTPNPVDCYTQECDTSGSNHSHKSPHDPLPEPTQLQYSETEYPGNSNHVENINEQNTYVHNIVPDPVLTIDLGILPENGTNVQIIEIPVETDVTYS